MSPKSRPANTMKVVKANARGKRGRAGTRLIDLRLLSEQQEVLTGILHDVLRRSSLKNAGVDQKWCKRRRDTLEGILNLLGTISDDLREAHECILEDGA